MYIIMWLLSGVAMRLVIARALLDGCIVVTLVSGYDSVLCSFFVIQIHVSSVAQMLGKLVKSMSNSDTSCLSKH